MNVAAITGGQDDRIDVDDRVIHQLCLAMQKPLDSRNNLYLTALDFAQGTDVQHGCLALRVLQLQRTLRRSFYAELLDVPKCHP